MILAVVLAFIGAGLILATRSPSSSPQTGGSPAPASVSSSQYLGMVQATALTYGLNALWVQAIIMTEQVDPSNWDANAVNQTGGDAARGGAYGLMQITLQTAKGWGFAGEPSQLLDPQTNLTVGCKGIAVGPHDSFDDVCAVWNDGIPFAQLDPNGLTATSYVPRANGFLTQIGGVA
jgi:soluble lytic murein transglycosylase-like protein